MKGSKSNHEERLFTMHSNVDPHGVRLRACVHSRTAAGHGLRQQSLCPLIPSCPAGRQISRGAGLNVLASYLGLTV